jgi:predicted restriction endonuclease
LACYKTNRAGIGIDIDKKYCELSKQRLLNESGLKQFEFKIESTYGKSINELVMEYFKNHPKEDLPHGPVVDWVTAEYLKYNDHPPRDPWRAIRQLHQQGFLIKIKKGIYRYEPDKVIKKEVFDFPPEIKEQIFKRDGYKCIWCGKSPKDGVELCADHIKPKDLGGDNSLENGQTLCMEHNLMKKNYSQTEAGKRYFINFMTRH